MAYRKSVPFCNANSDLSVVTDWLLANPRMNTFRFHILQDTKASVTASPIMASNVYLVHLCLRPPQFLLLDCYSLKRKGALR